VTCNAHVDIALKPVSRKRCEHLALGGAGFVPPDLQKLSHQSPLLTGAGTDGSTIGKTAASITKASCSKAQKRDGDPAVAPSRVPSACPSSPLQECAPRRQEKPAAFVVMRCEQRVDWKRW
jgi:hypothetical protein